MALSTDLAWRLRWLFLPPVSAELITILENAAISSTYSGTILGSPYYLRKFGDLVFFNCPYFEAADATVLNAGFADIIPAGFRPTVMPENGQFLFSYVLGGVASAEGTFAVSSTGSATVYADMDYAPFGASDFYVHGMITANWISSS